jgi:two-component system CheB/CheR fusion protein
VVLDRELTVIAWNHRSEDLWGLRADEVQGQNFLNLDIGLPTGALRSAIRACIAGTNEYADAAIEATNRRGRGIVCKVVVTPLLGAGKEVRGAIVMMDEQSAAKIGA